MKKNYIAPNTEMTTWASMGLMQQIGFGVMAASGDAGFIQKETNDVNIID